MAMRSLARHARQLATKQFLLPFIPGCADNKIISSAIVPGFFPSPGPPKVVSAPHFSCGKMAVENLQRRWQASAAHKKGLKIMAVLYKGGQYAEKNPSFLGNVENGLGLKDWLQEQGHEYILTDDKDGENSELEKHLPDVDILITTPFHPAYVTAERIKKAKKLKLLLTAGVGSDHVDIPAAAKAGLVVAEVTGSNVVSVAEDELLRILLLVRNFLPAWRQVEEGAWNVAKAVHLAHDVEGKTISTVGGGRIGFELFKRLKAFNSNLIYYDRVAWDKEKEEATGAVRETDLDTLLSKSDVVVLNLPLTDQTRGLLNREKLSKLKKGAIVVNNARGQLVAASAVVDAIKSGHLAGYSGDVWYPQPPPKDHPWRLFQDHDRLALTPHISGSTLDAQARFAAGTKDILDRWFHGLPFLAKDYIVKDGNIAPQYQ